MTRPVVITASPTAFNEDGSLDCESTKKGFEHAIRAGIDALFVAGTTGEFSSLSRDERKTIVRLALEVAGSNKTIVHVGTAAPYRVSLLADDARELGATRFAVITPYFMSSTLAGVERQVRAVAKREEEDLYLYVFPDRTGVQLEATEAAQLIEAEGLSGVKISIAGTDYVSEVRENLVEGAVAYSGNDGLMREVLAAGGDGIVSGVSSALPSPFVALADAIGNGDHENVSRLAEDVNRIVPVLGPNIAGLKLALVDQGLFETTFCRMSIDQPNAESRRRIEEIVREFSV